MRALLPAVLLLLATCLPATPSAVAEECSPVPQVVTIRCPDVPLAGTGAVALYHVNGAVLVRSTPDLACTAASVVGNTASTTCASLVPGAPMCIGPQVFAMAADLAGTMSVTGDCGLGATTSCATAAAPANHCFGVGAGIGTFPLTCAATIDAPATVYDWTWWTQCTVPV